MKPKAIVLSLAVFLVCSAMATAQTYTGVIKVDTVEAHPGNSLAVTVRLANNNASFSGLSIPLKFNSAYLTLDSVSFVGSFKPAATTGAYDYFPLTREIRILYLPPLVTPPYPSVSDVNGIVAQLFFKVLPGAAQGAIKIDSIFRDSIITFPAPAVLRTNVNLSNGDGTVTYLPGYVAGAVKVLVPTDVNDDNGGSLPAFFRLSQNYPNPFNPSTTIEFALPRASHVKLQVFNILGQEKAVLLDKQMEAGDHRVDFDASNYPSGIYFYRLIHDTGADTKKMILIK